jgi:hypothetical protein
MKMVEPVEMPLPSHPHILPRRDMGAPQTSNHDVCTRGDRLNGFAIWFSPMGITYPN